MHGELNSLIGRKMSKMKSIDFNEIAEVSAMLELERAIDALWPSARDKQLTNEQIRLLGKARDTLGAMIYVSQRHYDL